jgi:ABC transporter family protein
MTKQKALWGMSFALTTCAWYAWIPLYYRLPIVVGAVLHGLAIALATAAHRSEPDALQHRNLPLLFGVVVATVMAYAALPWGGRIAALTLCTGVMLAEGIHSKKLQPLGLSMQIVGLVSLAQAACSGLYGLILSTDHYGSSLAFLDVYIGRFLGLNVSAIGKHVYFPSPGGYVSVLPSWDQAGLIFGIIAVVGILVLMCLLSTRRTVLRTTLRAVAITVTFLVVRRLLLLLLALQFNHPELFWEPVALLLTFGFLPLILVLSAFSARDMGEIILTRVLPFTWKHLCGIAGLAVLGTLLITSSIFLATPGEKTGTEVIAFDESHGDWESTLRPLDKDWYGMQSTYNYASLYQWLSYYYDVAQITEPLDTGILDNVSVLVLKIPSIPYSDGEIEAIVSFVEMGGGLYVIGDHTNVFGTTSVLNPLLERFGLSLNYDATYDLLTKSFTVFEPSSLSLDPIMQHVERLEFLTSCTLNEPIQPHSALRANGMLANQADYATRDFFAADRVTLSSEFGSFAQNLAIQHKRGRVVVFTDSTCFSNFSIHMDGYPSLVLGTLGFLSRAGSAFSYPLLGMSLGLVAALGCVILARKRRTRIALLAVSIGVLFGWGLATFSIAHLHASWYPLPAPQRTIPYIYFDLAHSEGTISAQPLASTDETPPSEAFNTFFVWTQRAGLVPAPVDGESLSKLANGRPILLINPASALDDSFLNELVEYVEHSAGQLMVMVQRDIDPNRIADILNAFDLSAIFDKQAGWLIANGEIYKHKISPALTIGVSIANHGEGKIILIGDSVPFSDLSMGGAFNVPSSVQRTLYDLEFWLLDHVQSN